MPVILLHPPPDDEIGGDGSSPRYYPGKGINMEKGIEPVMGLKIGEDIKEPEYTGSQDAYDGRHHGMVHPP